MKPEGLRQRLIEAMDRATGEHLILTAELAVDTCWGVFEEIGAEKVESESMRPKWMLHGSDNDAVIVEKPGRYLVVPLDVLAADTGSET